MTASVVFPESADGRRSTSALGQAVVAADALRQGDPAGARSAERQSNWRSGSLGHFRRLIEAGLASRQAAVLVARDGLESLHRRMRVADDGGEEAGLDALISAPARGSLTMVDVLGWDDAARVGAAPTRASGWPETRCGAGSRPAGQPGHRAVVRGGAPDGRGAPRLALPGRTVVALGGGRRGGTAAGAAELGGPGSRRGPAPAGYLGAGPRGGQAQRWDPGGTGAGRAAGLQPGAGHPAQPGHRQGHGPPGWPRWTGRWCSATVYADSGDNVRLASAVDALTVRLQAARGDVALAFLATPTDVFAVPGDAVAHSARAYADRSAAAARRLAAARAVRRAAAASS